MLRNKVKVPNREVRLEESLSRKNLTENDKKYAHRLGLMQWRYHEELAREGGFEVPSNFYKDAYLIWSAYRKTDLLHYKDGQLRNTSNGIEIVHPAYKEFEGKIA